MSGFGVSEVLGIVCATREGRSAEPKDGSSPDPQAMA